MIQTRAALHPIYDPESLYGRMRGPETFKLKMFEFTYSKWSMARQRGTPFPTASLLPAAELSALTRRLGVEVLDAKPIRWRLVDEAPGGEAILCLVREADCPPTITLVLPPLGIKPPAQCRAYLIEPEVAARMQDAVGDRPWTDAFRAEVLADNADAARALIAAPEIEGAWDSRTRSIRFNLIKSAYDRFLLPPLDPDMVAVVFVEPA
ncbi:MAG: hypothetical protein K2W96_04385 [Gemmataceae bacterium]|nr:hypothetical protein [Gemmataceae bacterium]